MLEFDFAELTSLIDLHRIIIITDENIHTAHAEKLQPYPCIILEPGEASKQQATVDFVIQELTRLQADKSTFLVGVGGGVITDITGFVAAVYMRGIACAFAPTTILAMVDACIGGKNGIDVGIYKNLIGTIRQPDYLLYDFSFLKSLPHKQWVNGFAEIIKHACIKDPELFLFLEQNDLHAFQADEKKLVQLVERNIQIKTGIVIQDEFEQGDRKLLNFGHTLGHAIENTQHLLHGFAVSIGMVAALRISEEVNELDAQQKEQVMHLLQKYQLPVKLTADMASVKANILMDKKRKREVIQFILLNRIGDAVVKEIPLIQLNDLFDQVL